MRSALGQMLRVRRLPRPEETPSRPVLAEISRQDNAACILFKSGIGFRMIFVITRVRAPRIAFPPPEMSDNASICPRPSYRARHMRRRVLAAKGDDGRAR